MLDRFSIDFKNVRIGHKLPAAFIIISVGASLIVGATAYIKAADNIERQAKQTYSGYAAARASSLNFYLNSIRHDLDSQSVNPAILRALQDFKAAWAQLPGDREGNLQKAYITENPHPIGEKHKLRAAPGEAEYHRVHARHHPWIRRFLENRGYYDIFLFAPNGDLIYTVFKELDYATNLVTGKWKDTDLGNAFRAARDNSKSGFKVFFDFRPYAPSHDAPASFISTPIVSESGSLEGVLVFQMPIDRINQVMQVSEGMGESGETYIVGSDRMMRSDSRFSEESTILKTRVPGTTVDLALQGKSGVQFVDDYRGISVLSAYQPVEFLGAKWAILAEIDEAEILAPAEELRSFMIVFVVVIAVITAALGIGMSNGITSAIDKMGRAVDLVASGDTTAEIPGTERKDAIGGMANSLTKIQGAARDAQRLQMMVENMPTNVMMCDPDSMEITYVNQTSINTLRPLEHLLPVKVDELVGTCIDVFHKTPERQRELLADPANLPHRAQIQLGDEKLALGVSAIIDGGGNYIGPMLTWDVVTAQSKIGEEVRDVTDSVAIATEKLRNIAEEMAARSNKGSGRSMKVADESSATKDRVNSVAAATEELSGSVASINSQVTHSSTIAREAVEKANEVNRGVTSLAEAASRIGNVVELIEDIAEQTNLLALNATIEAARAGDAGKGFAVVAAEVKTLANQTGQATEEIGTQISAIQEEINLSVNSIGEITEIIDAIDNVAAEIKSAVEQQAAATQEISSNIQEASIAMDRVASDITDVTQTSVQTVSESFDVLWGTDDILEPSQRLRRNVETFLAT